VQGKNTSGYLVVPDGWTLAQTLQPSLTVAKAVGDLASYAMMVSWFKQGGAFDIQRQYAYANGSPSQFSDPVGAFKDSGSYILGYAIAGLDLSLTGGEIGGGLVNKLFSNDPDKNGFAGLDSKNQKSIEQGYSDYQIANPPTPSNPTIKLDGTFDDPASGTQYAFTTNPDGSISFSIQPGASYSVQITSVSGVMDAIGDLTQSSTSYAGGSIVNNYFGNASIDAALESPNPDFSHS
jgi:hypothetical protein